jgi:hypothetical protein
MLSAPYPFIGLPNIHDVEPPGGSILNTPFVFGSNPGVEIIVCCPVTKPGIEYGVKPSCGVVPVVPVQLVKFKLEKLELGQFCENRL